MADSDDATLEFRVAPITVNNDVSNFYHLVNLWVVIPKGRLVNDTLQAGDVNNKLASTSSGLTYLSGTLKGLALSVCVDLVITAANPSPLVKILALVIHYLSFSQVGQPPNHIYKIPNRLGKVKYKMNLFSLFLCQGQNKSLDGANLNV